MNKWNERLENWRENWVNQDKWNRQHTELEKEYTHLQEQACYWLELLKKEQQDVESLRGMSLSNLFYSCLGRKGDVLDQQLKEVVEATLKYNETTATVRDIREEMLTMEQKLGELGNLEAEYELIMQEKERLIHDTDSSMSQSIYEILALIAEARVYLKELKESMQAGGAVLHSLYLARDSLGSAGRWGAWDMLGGGMITTAIKHSRMNDSQEHIHDAQRKMRHLHKELQDLEMHIHVHFDSNGLLKFADFFFDGLIVDWIVQGHIHSSEEQVVVHTKKISKIMEQLRTERESWENRIIILQKDYRTLIEEAK